MDELNAKDLYAVLGVARDAPAREIRRAYRRLARRHHPDLNADSRGSERFARLANAYEILHDPAQRARYDRTLPQTAFAPQPPSGIRDRPPPAAGVRCGILELSPAEASYVARFPLALHDARGNTIVLPAGTGHGDQVTVPGGVHTAILTVRTRRKT